MTSEAQEEIFWNGMDYTSTMPFAGGLSYTLTTHAQAMVAAAYEDAAEACAKNRWLREGTDEYSRGLYQGSLDQSIINAKAIRARTPDDARAALDAMLRAERVKALRDAADCIGHITQAEDRDAILALIEKETGHE